MAAAVMLAFQANAQHKPLYSQYMFNMLNVNPAYAGIRDVANVNVLYRNQWTGYEGANSTASVSFDDRLRESNSSWGAQVYYDQIGIEKTTGVQGFYSFTAPMKNSALALGLNYGLLNYRSQLTKTNPLQTGDPLLQEDISRILPSVGFGALWYGQKWYVGFSIPSLLKSKITTFDQPFLSLVGNDIHYYLNGGYSFDLSENVRLKPSVLLKATSGAGLQTDFNMNLWLSNIVGIGASYRTGDALIGMLELQLTPKLRLGYAYDHNISTISNYVNGSQEFMLRFEFGNKQNNKITSPRFY